MRRQAILEALHRRISTGQAVLAAGCSAGIIARSAEEGGADLIVVYSTGRSRLMGLPTWRFGDSKSPGGDKLAGRPARRGGTV